MDEGPVSIDWTLMASHQVLSFSGPEGADVELHPAPFRPRYHVGSHPIVVVRGISVELTYRFDVVVVGAGHAGVEAAMAAARLGLKTCLLTMNADAVAQMSCNPAIGGVAKGQIVREIDALGGVMGKCTDASGIQFRVLNASKGPAMHSPRAQCDKKLYQFTMKRWVEEQENLTLRQELVEGLLLEENVDSLAHRPLDERFGGDRSRRHASTAPMPSCSRPARFSRRSCTPAKRRPSAGGPATTPPRRMSDSLASAGFELARFKTGTPCRLNGRTIDFTKCEVQPGDDPPRPFSFATESITVPRSFAIPRRRRRRSTI